jgi:hypothetical protein
MGTVMRIFFAIAVAWLAMASPSFAASVGYDVTGMLSDGGALSGSFTYDTVANTYSNINLTTSGGTSSTQTYTTVDPGAPATVGYLYAVTTSGTGDGEPVLILAFLAPLSSAGLSSALNPTSSGEYTCGTSNNVPCSKIASTVRTLTAGEAINPDATDQCKNNAVNACTMQCADIGECIFGCEIGGINNINTCSSSCTGLGTPCLNSCIQTVNAINICLAPTIGGTVSGLGADESLVLQNNGGDNLAINANGAFTFPTWVPTDSSYLVTVSTQPTGQFCVVANGSGTVTGDVANVSVSCASTVPTLSEWGAVLLAGLLTICGLLLVGRMYFPSRTPEG